MHLNTEVAPPPRKPCIRDLHLLTIAPGALLPAALVMLTPLEELARRCHEIAATHPQYQEETPLVLRGEELRRQRLSGALTVTVNHRKVA